MPRFLIPFLALVSLAVSTSAWAQGTSATGNLSIGVTQSQTITGISLANSSFTGGAASGTVIGAISVTMSPTAPAFSGTLSLTGANASRFQIVGSNLETNGVVPAGTYQINLVATQSGATASPFTQAETLTGTSSTVSTCPRGTAYVSAGDGCAGAQATGSVQVANFFTGFTGQSYPARPPWNVAGVDYPVGYSGTLNDPTTVSLPACVTAHSGSTWTINTDHQPCVLDHLDFGLH